MKFEIGDTVLVLHSGEEGEVVEIINDKMVTVDIKGIRFPAYIDQLDFPYFKRFTEKKSLPQKKNKQYVDDIRTEKPSRQPRVADGAWLSFWPVYDTDEFGDEYVKELKIYLVNRTETIYEFAYRLNYFGRIDFELKNRVHPFENFYLHNIPFEDLNDNPVFSIEFSLAQPDKKKAPYHESSLKLKAKQVFNRIGQIQKDNEPSFSYLLFEQYPDKPAEEYFDVGKLAGKGFKIYDAKKAKENLESPRSVIDLHIEKLTNDWQYLSNYEILSLQLKTFDKYYDLALAHLQPSLIVIHGVGTGKLRDEIHEKLRLKKEVKSFVNQYDPRFGDGATEIFFEY